MELASRLTIRFQKRLLVAPSSSDRPVSRQWRLGSRLHHRRIGPALVVVLWPVGASVQHTRGSACESPSGAPAAGPSRIAAAPQADAVAAPDHLAPARTALRRASVFRPIPIVRVGSTHGQEPLVYGRTSGHPLPASPYPPWESSYDDLEATCCEYQVNVCLRPTSRGTSARNPRSRSARRVSQHRRGCPAGLEVSK